jgi:threonine/homoserine/homoserine lactone efflux protein
MLMLACGAQHGWRRTLPAVLGINTGVALLTLAACLGLGALFTAWPLLHAALKLAGTLYMLVLAWRLAAQPLVQARAPEYPGFVQAVLFQWVNPKSWVKAVTLASVFMPAGMGVLPGALLVCGIGAVIGFPCTSSWVLFGVGIGRFLSSPTRQRAFNAIMAASLAVLALMLLR